jgi:hypothetical protein
VPWPVEFALKSYTNPPRLRRFFTVVNFELGASVSMSWFLSDKDRTAIREAAGLDEQSPDSPVGKAIEELKSWWDQD